MCKLRTKESGGSSRARVYCKFDGKYLLSSIYISFYIFKDRGLSRRPPSDEKKNVSNGTLRRYMYLSIKTFPEF